MKLSIVMPVYNEAAFIREIVKRVLAVDLDKELIIVDDGSTDGTREILRELEDERVRVIYHPRNMGKGAALRTGLRECRGSLVVVQDADLEYDPAELPMLMEPIEKGVADVVYGSRLSGGKPQRVHLFWHKVGNTFLTLVTNILFNTTLTDMETCYKMFRADVLKDIEIRSNDFTVEPELTAKVLKKKCRVYEMPISYYGRSYSEGKKISWKHGLGALWALFKYRFTD
ncbi:MAG: glycosyltransferase family 2 protein [Nitrospinota bacterium]